MVRTHSARCKVHYPCYIIKGSSESLKKPWKSNREIDSRRSYFVNDFVEATEMAKRPTDEEVVKRNAERSMSLSSEYSAQASG